MGVFCPWGGCQTAGGVSSLGGGWAYFHRVCGTICGWFMARGLDKVGGMKVELWEAGRSLSRAMGEGKACLFQ